MSPRPLSPACRECGCTDERACLGGCAWAEPDLCSACAAPVQASLGPRIEQLLRDSIAGVPDGHLFAGGASRVRATARLDSCLPQPLLRVHVELELALPAERVLETPGG